MNTRTRSLLAAVLGVVVFLIFAYIIGVERVWQNIRRVSLLTAGVIVLFVLTETLIDAVRFRASTFPLQETVSIYEGFLLSLMGDLIGIFVPAGGIVSEPIIAYPLSNATNTEPIDAFAVRAAADYLEVLSQLLVSLVILLAFIGPQYIPVGVIQLPVIGVIACALLAVFVASLSGLNSYQESINSIADRLRIRSILTGVRRIIRGAVSLVLNPAALGSILLLSVGEQLIIAGSIWMILPNKGVHTLLILVAIVPIGQVAAVVPVPGAIGIYDTFAAGLIYLIIGVPLPAATVAVAVPRSVGLIFTLLLGSVATVKIRRLLLPDI